MGLPEVSLDGEDIFWNIGQRPSDYSLIRVSGEGDCKRDAKDVPLKEAENAVLYVLKQQISLEETDLIKESAKLMGYPRMGTNVTALFRKAVQSVQASDLIDLDSNGKWKLK